MKLLLAVASVVDIQKSIEHLGGALQQDTALKFLYTCKILHHEVEVLETGYGVYQTAYKTTKVISKTKYHLALKLSLGNAYKPDIEPGSVLNIVNEKPGDYGIMEGDEWRDLYDLNLINRDEPPHVRGGLVNLTNAYMNVMMPFKKAVGVSVNHYADKSSFQLRRDKYKADCETGDGIGFVYPCLFEKQLFYHLCVIEKNLATGSENPELAKGVLNNTLTDLLQKL